MDPQWAELAIAFGKEERELETMPRNKSRVQTQASSANPKALDESVPSRGTASRHRRKDSRKDWSERVCRARSDDTSKVVLDFCTVSATCKCI